MKKIVAFLLTIFIFFSTTACTTNETKQPTDLTGTWKSENNDGSWMEAIITENVMYIYWVSDNGDTKSIYWVGTYTAPNEYVKDYTWTSERDKEATDMALLASTADTKDFTYSEEKIVYETSAFGMTTTKELIKESSDVTLPDAEDLEVSTASDDSDNNFSILDYSYLEHFIYDTDKNSSNCVDAIASAAKENYELLADDDVEQIISMVSDNYPNFYEDAETMELYMYYGYLLAYACDDSETESELGVDLYQAIKYVYRGSESVDDVATQENLRQIEKSLSLLGKIQAEPEDTSDDNKTMTLGEENALKAALSYLDYTSFSRSGLIKQLEYEGFTNEEATFAVDNCEADWNEQAAKTARSYLDYSSFSRSELIEQLEYEGFTSEQAEYGVTQVGY